MKVLLINGGRPVAGSAMTTHALGRRLVSAGHDVITLVSSDGRSPLDPILGSRSRIVPGHGYPVWSSPAPKRALPRLLRLFQPDVVVADGREAVEAAEAAHRRFVDPGAVDDAMATIGVGPAPASETADSAGPSLSVVIPAHNAVSTLDEQLDAVLSQEWDRAFEVIVADNASTDGTAELVRRRMRADPRLRLVDVPKGRSASVARNAGASVASADGIAFCDADDVVAPGWVAAMGEALAAHRLVAGRVDVESLNPSGLARSRGLAVGRGPGRFGVVPFAHGCNIGVQRTALDAVGRWDEATRIGEDIELCLRLWQIGVELYDEPSAVVRYRYHLDRGSQWRQAVSYGTAHVDLARRFEVRQLPRPKRLEGWRNMAWLVRHAGDVLDAERRPHWLWTAGLRLGRLRGSLQWRTTYL